ncbi:MAG: hypothetical protein DCC68_11100 [Planctomycetota bacterium]|nr:MAG: hypothetical protein DCC68_11100 [Planctomycetota bacterium]
MNGALNGVAKALNGAAKRINGVRKLNGARTHLAPGDSPGAIDATVPAISTPPARTAKPARATKPRKSPKKFARKARVKKTATGKHKASTRSVRPKRSPESRIPNPAPSPTPDPRLLTPAADRRLIDRALAKEPGAWDDLYYRCHQPLLAAIRAIIGSRRLDPNLVDELAARVWYAVVRDDAKLLDRFDPGRGCSLTTYLALLAKDEASRLFRSEKRRRKRETAVATSDKKLPAKSAPATGATQITLAEFAATLTPAERTFYEEIVVSDSPAETSVNGESSTPKPSPNGHPNGRSQANEWQLNHRVRRKLERFLTG